MLALSFRSILMISLSLILASVHIYIFIYTVYSVCPIYNEYRVCHPSKLARFTCESCQQLVANLAQELQHPEASS